MVFIINKVLEYAHLLYLFAKNSDQTFQIIKIFLEEIFKSGS